MCKVSYESILWSLEPYSCNKVLSLSRWAGKNPRWLTLTPHPTRVFIDYKAFVENKINPKSQTHCDYTLQSSNGLYVRRLGVASLKHSKMRHPVPDEAGHVNQRVKRQCFWTTMEIKLSMKCIKPYKQTSSHLPPSCCVLCLGLWRPFLQ